MRAAVVLAVAAPLVFEQTGFGTDSFARSEFYPLVDAVAPGLSGADAGYVLPKFGENVTIQGELLGAWTGLRANVPVVNGYSGRRPAGYAIDEADVDGSLRRWLAGKYRSPVAVLDPDPRRGGVRYVDME